MTIAKYLLRCLKVGNTSKSDLGTNSHSTYETWYLKDINHCGQNRIIIMPVKMQYSYKHISYKKYTAHKSRLNYKRMFVFSFAKVRCIAQVKGSVSPVDTDRLLLKHEGMH